MATLRQAIDFAKKNPEDARSLELIKQIKSGGMDEKARGEGIDLTGKSKTFKVQKESFSDRVSDDIQERAENINQAIAGEDEFAGKSLLAKGTGATAQAFGAISNTAFEALPEVARNALDKIGGGIGKGFEALTGKIGESKFLQEAVQGDTSKLEEALQIASDLGLISGEILGAKELASNTTGAVTASRNLANKAVKTGTKGVNTGRKVIKNIGDKTGISEAIPTPERLVEFQTTRALDLTQGDVKNISKSTGNEVGDFLAKNNLIGKNKVDTSEIVKKFGDDSFEKVREEIGKVDKTFSKSEIPRYEDALTEVLETVKGKRGLESSVREVEDLLKKETLNLSDAQRAKELIDENFKLFKITGDKAESAAKEGVRNLRSELREFIENTVDEAGGEDIRTLNNNVATSRGITNAIADRSTRGLTRSSVGLGDLGTFGVGSTFGGPLVGVAAVVGKKIIESSAVRLRFSKWLDNLTDAKKAKVAKELSEGKVPKDMAKAIKFDIPTGTFTAEVIEKN